MEYTNLNLKIGLLFLFVLSILVAGCGGEECSPDFEEVFPQSSSVKLVGGRFENFYFSVNSCGSSVSDIVWTLDDKEYATGTTLVTVNGCPDQEGQHSLALQVKFGDGKTVSRKWTVEISREADPDVPACYGKALETVRQGLVGVDASQSPTGMNMSEAMKCIDEYLKVAPCNLEANMAAGIAHMAVSIANAPAHILLALTAFNNGVEAYIKAEIDPLIKYFSVVAKHGDSRFKFVVDRMTIDVPQMDVTFNLSGEYDLGDARFFTGLFEVIKGLLTTGLAYNGFYEMPLILMEKDWEKSLIARLKRDPTFLMLTGEDGRDGEAFLSTAQSYLVNGLDDLISAVTSIESESDPQVSNTNPEENDVIRYWDCGKDGVCPPEYSDYPDGDPREPFQDENGNGEYDPGEPYEDLNGNGEWNDSWLNIGPDEGENDGRYTDGEPIGTEIIAGETIKVPGGSKLISFLASLRDNIKGPDPLDLDSFFGVPSGTVRTQFQQLGIPYPEIRLSEFFVTPSNLRNLLPLYSISQEKFFDQPEEEPWKDWGVDRLQDSDEPYYDPVTNPDPHHDDYNLETNMSDGYDNDGDGYVDTADPDGDFGLEGNGEYDWLDTGPTPGKQDIGEPCEPFDDVGVETPDGLYGANNGVWDQIDTDHRWPSGDDVGGPVVNIEIDPRNGTIKDKDQRLIDNVYFFFPDATFSGVLIFPDPTINVDGRTLTRNAELFRFIGKLRENAYYLMSF